MRHFNVIPKDGSEPYIATAEDDQDAPPGHDPADYTFEETTSAPDERELLKTKMADPAAMEQWAVEEAERRADEYAAANLMRLRRAVAMMNLWREIQFLKLANHAGMLTGSTVQERADFCPTLMAVVERTGDPLAQVAAALETRLRLRVRHFARIEAKLMLAHDAIRAAPDADAKLAALDAIDWR